jgi:hypothetical protein
MCAQILKDFQRTMHSQSTIISETVTDNLSNMANHITKSIIGVGDPEGRVFFEHICNAVESPHHQSLLKYRFELSELDTHRPIGLLIETPVGMNGALAPDSVIVLHSPVVGFSLIPVDRWLTAELNNMMPKRFGHIPLVYLAFDLETSSEFKSTINMYSALESI